MDLFDVLSNAIAHQPLEGMRYEKVFSQSSIRQLKEYLELHENNVALLYVVDRKRVIIPQLVTLEKAHSSGILVKYKCYNPYGEFRQFVYTFITYNDLYCRCKKLKLFGNI